jgi:DNA gyrase subunit A
MFVHEDEDILLITDDGTIIRARAADVRLCGRATQGVRIMRLAEGSTVVGVCRAEKEEEEIPEDIQPAEGTDAPETASETAEKTATPETEGPVPDTDL